MFIINYVIEMNSLQKLVNNINNNNSNKYAYYENQTIFLLYLLIFTSEKTNFNGVPLSVTLPI
jgi:hypothetical protein